MSNVYLMSIRPEYSARIFDGTKTFELRRRPVRIARADVVVVYETSPTRAVVGAFQVKSVRSDSPRRIWRDLGRSLGISRRAFDEYFAGAVGACAIEVGDVCRIAPVTLAEVREELGGFVPPQSYLRLVHERLVMLPAQLVSAVMSLAAAG